jgi:hypothetical protein
MAREWTLGRTEAEFLDGVLLEHYQRTGIGMAHELGDQLARLFGMAFWEDRMPSPSPASHPTP